jgi:DNA-directed RNA polymerase specialized sigma subunit
VRRYCRKYGVELPGQSAAGGRPSKPPPRCAKEEVVAAADAFAASHGRLPTNPELADVLGVSRATIFKYKKKYGVELPRKMKHILFTKEELVARRDAFAAEHGRPPTLRELAAVLGVPMETVCFYRRKYGLEYSFRGAPPSRTKEAFLATIDAFAAEHGRPPTSRELAAVLGVSINTLYSYRKRYGGSLYRKNSSITYTKEEVVAAVDAFAAEHGRLPSRRELAASLGVACVTVGRYCIKYGVELSRKTN